MREIIKHINKRILCIIDGVKTEALVVQENGNIFLLQDDIIGMPCKDTRGYKYSWIVDENNVCMVHILKTIDEINILNRLKRKLERKRAIYNGLIEEGRKGWEKGYFAGIISTLEDIIDDMEGI